MPLPRHRRLAKPLGSSPSQGRFKPHQSQKVLEEFPEWREALGDFPRLWGRSESPSPQFLFLCKTEEFWRPVLWWITEGSRQSAHLSTLVPSGRFQVITWWYPPLLASLWWKVFWYYAGGFCYFRWAVSPNPFFLSCWYRFCSISTPDGHFPRVSGCSFIQQVFFECLPCIRPVLHSE